MRTIFAVVLVPVWAPIMFVWFLTVLMTAPWRMLIYGDSFWGGPFLDRLRGRTVVGKTVSLFLFILLIPIIFITGIPYTLARWLSLPFRHWFFNGIGGPY